MSKKSVAQDKKEMVIQDASCFKEKAIRFFQQGYACSEAFIKSAYECGIIDKKSDIKLLTQIASPFVGGVKSSGCVCGALVGAQMTIGCLIGRKDISYSNTLLKEVSKKLVDEFKKRGHDTCCRASVPEYNETPDEKQFNCSKTIEDVIDVLYENILKDIKSLPGD